MPACFEAGRDDESEITEVEVAVGNGKFLGNAIRVS